MCLQYAMFRTELRNRLKHFFSTNSCFMMDDHQWNTLKIWKCWEKKKKKKIEKEGRACIQNWSGYQVQQKYPVFTYVTWALMSLIILWWLDDQLIHTKDWKMLREKKEEDKMWKLKRKSGLTFKIDVDIQWNKSILYLHIAGDYSWLFLWW